MIGGATARASFMAGSCHSCADMDLVDSFQFDPALIRSDMTDTPLISVVIPTRNRPELLIRAVRSALIQTYDSIEVVVVIDGRDQASVEALSEVSDARLRFIELEQSGGGNPARNIGVSAAKGNWVALLDDDDEWLPDK